MDSWLVVPEPRKVPEKSPGSVWDLAVPVFSQVSGAGAEGADMKVKYKETSRGGLNVIEC
ncbi:hypothetical protein PJ985_12270 [Streptomyces sp. ACA25]|uniref:hypothetical protein n=1 Tax=Streptomyces sp. ACA25 TaxID=3022596 RepID=UPI002307600F|nr:hypothetical protein [Streptomyces sp. ACA25]MDB1088341.1 hypothetical protein [Streptomyces sp. ACA25]